MGQTNLHTCAVTLTQMIVLHKLSSESTGSLLKKNPLKVYFGSNRIRNSSVYFWTTLTTVFWKKQNPTTFHLDVSVPTVFVFVISLQ